MKKRKLTKVDVKEISNVNSPANKRFHLVVKSAGSPLATQKADNTVVANSELMGDEDSDGGFNAGDASILRSLARGMNRLSDDVSLDDIMAIASEVGVPGAPEAMEEEEEEADEGDADDAQVMVGKAEAEEDEEDDQGSDDSEDEDGEDDTQDDIEEDEEMDVKKGGPGSGPHKGGGSFSVGESSSQTTARAPQREKKAESNEKSKAAFSASADAKSFKTSGSHNIAAQAHDVAARAAVKAGRNEDAKRHEDMASQHRVNSAHFKSVGKSEGFSEELLVAASLLPGFETPLEKADSETWDASAAPGTISKDAGMPKEAGNSRESYDAIIKSMRAEFDTKIEAITKSAMEREEVLKGQIAHEQNIRVLKNTHDEVVNDLCNLTCKPVELAACLKSVRETEGTKEHADVLLQVLKAANAQLGAQGQAATGSLFKSMGHSTPSNGSSAHDQLEVLVEKTAKDMPGKSKSQVYKHVISKTEDGKALAERLFTESVAN